MAETDGLVASKVVLEFPDQKRKTVFLPRVPVAGDFLGVLREDGTFGDIGYRVHAIMFGLSHRDEKHSLTLVKLREFP